MATIDPFNGVFRGWSGLKPGYPSILRYFQPNPRGLGSHGKAPQSLQNTIWRTFGSRRHDQRVPMRPTHGNTNQKYSGNPDSVQRKSCFGLNSKCIQLDTNWGPADQPARQNYRHSAPWPIQVTARATFARRQPRTQPATESDSLRHPMTPCLPPLIVHGQTRWTIQSPQGEGVRQVSEEFMRKLVRRRCR